MDGGGDGGFDPCECVYNHEGSMQRLLNVMRESQSYCSDNECYPEQPDGAGGDAPNTDALGGPTFYFMLFWMGLAMLFYLLRPRARRSDTQGKPGPSSRDGDDMPPPMPPVM